MDYYLDKDADSLDLKLEIFKGDRLLRSYTNQKPKDFKSWPGGPSKPQLLPSKKGYNRFTWDFRKEDLPSIDKVFIFGGHAGSTVGPGEYTLKLTLELLTTETKVNILPNPNIQGSMADYEEQQQMLDDIESVLKNIHQSVNDMRSAKLQLKGYAKLLKENEDAQQLLVKGDSLLERITNWEENLIQPKQKTFQDVINYNNKLNAQLIHLKNYIDAAEPKVSQGAKARWNDLKDDWKVYEQERSAIVGEEMEAYNRLYKELELPALILRER